MRQFLLKVNSKSNSDVKGYGSIGPDCSSGCADGCYYGCDGSCQSGCDVTCKGGCAGNCYGTSDY